MAKDSTTPSQTVSSKPPKRRKLDWFLPGMLVAVALAWIFPEPGAKGGWLYPEYLIRGSVALIFFLHGLALSFAALKSGMMHWRLHLVVQSCTFLLFPMIGIVGLFLFGQWLHEDLRTGFFYLCVLPSTVSSSVALTAVARGNVPAAVFNATVSSLLGVVITPFWMSLYTGMGHGPSIPIGEVLLDLVIWLICPIIVGQMLRPLLGSWAARNKPFINVVDRLAILLLVYISFCDSVEMGVWGKQGIGPVIITLLGTLLLFTAIFQVTHLICRILGFGDEDWIAVVFCGSKKSLATGVPMAQLMFASNPALGGILLPIMIYHPLQIIICGVFAAKWRDRRIDAELPADAIL